MPSPNLSFRTPSSLLTKIKSRDPHDLKSPGVIAKRDVERWYSALEDALKEIYLAPAEAVLLIGVVGRAEGPVDNAFVAGLADYVAAHPEDGYHHVQTRLVQKLNAMDRLTRWALVDAVERYVAYQAKHPDSTLGMALHQVGLHTYMVTKEELAELESRTADGVQDLKPIRAEES